MIKTKILENYLNYTAFYQLILWLTISYITKEIMQSKSIVYAEGWLISFVPSIEPKSFEDCLGIVPDLVEGNATCEDAAYNERAPLPQELSLDLTEKRIAFIDMIIQHVIKILEHAHPTSVDSNQVPDNSIKNATYMVLTKYGSTSEWVAHTEAEVNLRLSLILTIVQDEGLHPIEKRILCHLGTSLTIVSGATAFNVPSEQVINTFIYEETYAKFNR